MADYTQTFSKPSHPMKVLKTLVQLLVAGIFAAAEALLAIDDIRTARLAQRKHG